MLRQSVWQVGSSAIFSEFTRHPLSGGASPMVFEPGGYWDMKISLLCEYSKGAVQTAKVGIVAWTG